MNIVIVDYGLGNPASVKNIIKKVGGKSLISGTVADIEAADKVILPGVGHFTSGMGQLKKKGLIEILSKKALNEKVPIMGICLGMQLMTRYSEESNSRGLGWINAKTVRFDLPAEYKVPHMGWTEISFQKESIWSGLYKEQPRFYFVHSYLVVCEEPGDILARSLYGIEFDCAFEKGNITGVQFHPEKSHKFGMTWMEQFLKL